MHRSKTALLFDHFVGAGEERQREAERLGDPEVDDQLDCGGLWTADRSLLRIWESRYADSAVKINPQSIDRFDRVLPVLLELIF
jgi:hypothetical protein